MDHFLLVLLPRRYPPLGKRESPKIGIWLKAFDSPFRPVTKRLLHSGDHSKQAGPRALEIRNCDAVIRPEGVPQPDLGAMAVNHQREGLFAENIPIGSFSTDLDRNSQKHPFALSHSFTDSRRMILVLLRSSYYIDQCHLPGWSCGLGP